MSNPVTYRTLRTVQHRYPAERVERDRLFNVFVLGLPRSGTSMMTKCVELLGVKMAYTTEEDEARKRRDARYKRSLGADYHPNRDGFFEITRQNLWDCYTRIMQTPYSGCKMIVPVTPADPRMWVLRFQPRTRVILNVRDAECVRQSQQAFYGGDREQSAEEIRKWLSRIHTVYQQQAKWLTQMGVKVATVPYERVLEDPRGSMGIIAEFINAPNPIDAAVANVKRDQCRFSPDTIEAGI